MRNHPNIAAIYGLEESAEEDYLVLELGEGETPHGPLRLAAAIDYARHAAEALEAADEHGIIHRDLKPANFKVTPEGKVKMLDLGLAKAIGGTEQKSDLSRHYTDRRLDGRRSCCGGERGPEVVLILELQSREGHHNQK